MNRANARKTYRYRMRNKRYQTETSPIGMKSVVCLMLLLCVLFIKKYDFSIGNFNIHSIYDVLYYNENFRELSNKVLKINDTAFKDIFNLDGNHTEGSAQ